MRSVERQVLTHLQVQLVSVKASAVALAASAVAVVLPAMKLCPLLGASFVAGQVNVNSTVAVECLQETFAVLGLEVIARV